MSRNLLVFAFLVVFCIHSSLQLRCVPCTPDEIATCKGTGTLTYLESLFLCRYGGTKITCDCCYSCLKGPGQKCGGPWHLQGKCGDLFDCKVGNEVIDTVASALTGICTIRKRPWAHI